MNEHPGDAKAILDFAASRIDPKIITVHDPETNTDVPAFVGADGRISAVEPILLPWRDRDRPRRRKGTVTTHDIDSFVELVNRDASEKAIIFANLQGEHPTLTAVLNYHAPEFGPPEFADARIAYAFPFSDEWDAWSKSSGAKMDQATFATFIEEHMFDIGEPGSAGATTATFASRMGVNLAGPQRLMGLSRGLSLRVETKVQNHQKLESGETKMVFETEHKDEAGDPVNVPSAFHIMIPIVEGGSLYSIPAHLRYRVQGGKIVWFYELHQPEKFVRDAVNDVVARVKAPEDGTGETPKGCGLMVIMGAAPTVGA